MNQKFCSYCGKPLQAGQNFCAYCGKKVADHTTTAERWSVSTIISIDQGIILGYMILTIVEWAEWVVTLPIFASVIVVLISFLIAELLQKKVSIKILQIIQLVLVVVAVISMILGHIPSVGLAFSTIRFLATAGALGVWMSQMFGVKLSRHQNLAFWVALFASVAIFMVVSRFEHDIDDGLLLWLYADNFFLFSTPSLVASVPTLVAVCLPTLMAAGANFIFSVSNQTQATTLKKVGVQGIRSNFLILGLILLVELGYLLGAVTDFFTSGYLAKIYGLDLNDDFTLLENGRLTLKLAIFVGCLLFVVLQKVLQKSTEQLTQLMVINAVGFILQAIGAWMVYYYDYNVMAKADYNVMAKALFVIGFGGGLSIMAAVYLLCQLVKKMAYNNPLLLLFGTIIVGLVFEVFFVLVNNALTLATLNLVVGILVGALSILALQKFDPLKVTNIFDS